MRIDVQCHVFPRVIEEYMIKNDYPKCFRIEPGLMCDFGSQKLILPDFQYDPANIVRAMDRGQVDMSIISANIPDPGFFPPEIAAEIVPKINRSVMNEVEARPDRFFGLGFLSWNNPAAAVEQVAEVKAMGMKGVMLFTRNGDLQVDDPSLEIIYDAVEAADLPIFIHPTVPMWDKAIGDYGMVATCSFVIDTAFAFMRLCHSGILDRHPNLKVVIPHAGGVLPILDGRLSYTPPASRQFIDPNKRTVVETLHSEQVWFDLANPSKNVIKYFKDYMGLDRAMYGTDYPFVDQDFMTPLLDEMGFTEEEMDQINWKNANRLFKLGL